MKMTIDSNSQKIINTSDFDTLHAVIKIFDDSKPLAEKIKNTLTIVSQHSKACFAYYEPMRIQDNNNLFCDSIQYINNDLLSNTEQEHILKQTSNLSLRDIIDIPAVDASNISQGYYRHTTPLHRILHKYKIDRHLMIPISDKQGIISVVEFFFREETKPKTQLFDAISQHMNATHKQAQHQHELKSSVLRLENSQRISHIGSWEWKKNSDHCIWSGHVFELFGYPENSFQPSISALIEFAHFTQRRQLRTFFDNIDNSSERSIEYKAIHSKGHEITINIKTGVSQQDDMLTGIIQDISEQHQLNNMKADFISTVSHELRTPLTAIKGSLSLIEIDPEDSNNDSNIHLMSIAKKNIDRLLFLVNDILDIEKANSGELKLNLQDTNINQLITDAANQMTHYASQFNTNIKLNLHKRDIFSNIDQHRITQAILNILSNAIKYSPEGGTVTITTKTTGGILKVLISDEGKGIPEDMKDRIFDKFTQITSTPKNKIGGSGLGLSIAKILVEKHGGKIGINNTNENGCTFYIELNIIDSPIHRLIDSNQSASNESKDVLVIEDDIPTAKHLRILLQQLGYQVTNAYSIKQAREFVENNSYNLITVDVMLPDQNGLSFVREINMRDNKMPVFVISAVADIMRKKDEHKTLNVMHWFTKPFNHHEFVKIINSISSSANLEQAS